MNKNQQNRQMKKKKTSLLNKIKKKKRCTMKRRPTNALQNALNFIHQLTNNNYQSSVVIAQPQSQTQPQQQQQQTQHTNPFLNHQVQTKKTVALCVGINYAGTSSQLYGCINDAKNLKNWMIQCHSLSPTSIAMCLDDKMAQPSSGAPTKSNLMKQWRLSIEAISSGDTLIWSYSGHGTQVPDKTGLEMDCKSECLYTLDSQLVVDTELRPLIDLLPSESNLFFICDACHSGTILNLRHSTELQLSREQTTKTPNFEANYTLATYPAYVETKANVVSLSGCRDNQTSTDAYVNKSNQGALTYAFLKSLDHFRSRKIIPSYRQLLGQIERIIANEKLSDQRPQFSFGRSSISLDDPFDFFA